MFVQSSGDTLGYKHVTFVTKMFQEVKNTIDEHFESFYPSVSHYRRSHAPLRIYLASELSPRIMYEYFREPTRELLAVKSRIGVRFYRKILVYANWVKRSARFVKHT